MVILFLTHKLQKWSIFWGACLMALFSTQVAMADNPIVSQVFTADPAARVFNNRMYVVVSHDQDKATGYETLVDYYLYSSDDMVNWRDHGIVFDVRKNTTWAKMAFAPDFIERGGKYYLYFPNGADGIGVAVADQPEGPYVDALGKALITRQTPGVEGVQWVFDPGVFIDEDGQAYLYFGGGGPGNLRVVRLNNDMISLNGAVEKIEAPHYFEAPYMIKRNGLYYLSYSTNGDNGSITIDYLTSQHPMTGFKHQGTILANPWDNRGNNNHHSMLEWQGQWYMFYHNRGIAAERQAGVYERSINVDLLSFKKDAIVEVKATKASVPQLKLLNPFEKIEAETLDNEWGIETEQSSGGIQSVVFNQGDWIQIAGVDFKKGVSAMTLRVAVAKATTFELFVDDIKGKLLATVSVEATGNKDTWVTLHKSIKGLRKIRKLFIRAQGEVKLDWYQFEPAK
jgi:arabinoxylan arabinofuranohydrolase